MGCVFESYLTLMIAGASLLKLKNYERRLLEELATQPNEHQFWAKLPPCFVQESENCLQLMFEAIINGGGTVPTTIIFTF